MNKKTLIFFGILIIGAVALFSVRFILGGNEDDWICESGEWVKHGNPASPQPKIGCGEKKTEISDTAPLSTEEDIIRAFFALINEHRVSDAIAMMTPILIGDESGKQTWGVHFNEIKTISVKLIEPSMRQDWTNEKHTYKVTLDVAMKSEAANDPIPNYGWEEGSNIRWVSIEKVSNLWKISAIATGP